VQKQRGEPDGSAGRLSPLWVVVLAAATVAAISMGLRQVVGLYMVPLTEAIGVGRTAFGLAIAVANIVWGLAAPVAGAVADKYGTGRIVLFGAVTTVVGLLLLQSARSEAHLLLSGLFLGLGVAGSGTGAMVGAVGRRAPAERRTQAIAAVGIGGGFGMLVALPYTHLLMETLGWQTSLVVLAATAALILPLAVPLSGRPTASSGDTQRIGAALHEAARHPGFWLLNAGFFVCGFHIVFYATHLPAYVADKGLGPEVGVVGLTLIGVGNLIGTWLAGEWGCRWPLRYGLSLIYGLRALVFVGFLALPTTMTTVAVLSLAFGMLWLSTVPLTSGLVAVFFGPRWMTMLYGIVFLSHQAGAFLGAWLGGVIFDRLQSYDAMWWISVALGIFAALVNVPIVEKPVVRLANPTPDTSPTTSK
jgi:predicted MFS family arabinose efflux permease